MPTVFWINAGSRTELIQQKFAFFQCADLSEKWNRICIAEKRTCIVVGLIGSMSSRCSLRKTGHTNVDVRICGRVHSSPDDHQQTHTYRNFNADLEDTMT